MADPNTAALAPGLPAPPLWRQLAYGSLGLPLAFAALPIYVFVPRLYAGEGASLAVVGAVLLAVRIFDGLTDPLLGWLGDRLARRRATILAALPVLALGLVLLMLPPAGAGPGWLAASLLLVTLGHSLAVINHNAWGVELGTDAAARARLVAAREGCGLAGVLLAAALAGDGAARGAPALALGGCVLLLLCAPLCLGLAGRAAPAHPASGSPWAVFAAGLADPSLRRLLTVFAVNGIAAAIPATAFLFFVEDVLQAPARAGGFLALYFASGALGLPVWLALARRYGAVPTWFAAMLLAVAAFAAAGTLGAGDLLPYALVCLASGLALGADLTLPQALLAELLARPGQAARGGAWFGLWNLVTKANLALAAGLSLPLLGALGYVPGSSAGTGLGALLLVYGGLPLILKLAAAALLWRWRHVLTPQGAATS